MRRRVSEAYQAEGSPAVLVGSLVGLEDILEEPEGSLAGLEGSLEELGDTQKLEDSLVEREDSFVELGDSLVEPGDSLVELEDSLVELGDAQERAVHHVVEGTLQVQAGIVHTEMPIQSVQGSKSGKGRAEQLPQVDTEEGTEEGTEVGIEEGTEVGTEVDSLGWPALQQKSQEADSQLPVVLAVLLRFPL